MKEFINKLIESFLGECVIYAENYEKALNIANELTEEYINTSTDTSSDTSSGWIACSERLPEANQKVLTCDKDGWISVNVNMPYIGVRNDFECGYYVAWMPLPAPYKEGVTENERNSRV